MNIYEKLQTIKLELLQSNLKKSGRNHFANFAYYELSDILPAIMSTCSKYKVFTKISYTDTLAELTAINAENPEETVTITSPMRDVSLSKCNEIQSLGGVETYSRRYLYMTLFDITENDMFDGQENNAPQNKNSVESITTSKIPEFENILDTDISPLPVRRTRKPRQI